MASNYDINELKRRMQGAIGSLKTELGGLRTGRASAHLLDPVHVDAYGQSMALNQVATVSVPPPGIASRAFRARFRTALSSCAGSAIAGHSPAVST